MSVPYVLDIQRTTAPKRLHAQAATIALKSVARTHLGAPMGKRFAGGPETEPGGLFGFVPRAKSYDETKEKVKGHTDPLRGFTDALRNSLQRTAKVTGTQSRAVIRLRSPHPLKAAQWKELTFVPVSEARVYVALGNNLYATALRGLQQRQARERARIT